MTCPHCKCPECARGGLPKSPLSNLPGWSRAEQLALEQFAELHNARILQTERAKSDWRDTVGEGR